ncbi:MAG: phosphatase PAP2 family protein [Spirochaetes bacterium]|nr:phosphatase PAP2 family protein [Spirochaetota bacterium]
MPNKIVSCLLLPVFFLLAVAFPARAEEKKEKAASPFFVNLKVDLPVITISTLTAVSVRILVGSLPRSHITNLDTSRVNSMDRPVIGYQFPGWGLAGDIGCVLVPAATMCLSFVELPKYGWSGMIEDFLIVGEAVAVSSMFNQIVAGAMPRARPYMYRYTLMRKQARNSSWDWRSFYSGHAGACFSATIAFSYLLTVRYPESKWLPAAWVMSVATSSLVGISRVFAGEHFWSDTIIGSVIGACFGILIPVLHQRKPEIARGDVRLSFSADKLGMTCYF